MAAAGQRRSTTAGQRREGGTITEASIAGDRTEPPRSAGESSVADLESALDREIELREAAQRRAERLAQDREDAYERLLVRCRALEEEALLWPEERAGILARQGAALQDSTAAFRTQTAALDAQITDLEARIAELQDRLSAAASQEEERERLHRDTMERHSRALTEAHEAERRRLSADFHEALSAAEDRLHGARHDLVEAEKAFRVEAYRLSALVALKAKEAEDRASEAAGLRDRLHAVLTSSSWRLSRPLRTVGRLLARVRP